MLIENVFSLVNIMAMERQCLDHLEFDLVVSEEEVEFVLISMLRFFGSPTLPLVEPVLPSSIHLDEEIDSWLHGVSPEHIIAVTGDMSSQWFESPQPSFQYLCTRRASAPAILDHHDQPAICSVPLSYAAFPSDVSDGVSSYPATPAGQCGADLDFDLDELYEEVEVALDNVENHVYSGELVCPVQCPTMRYSESDINKEYGPQLYARGRSTHSKPLGDSGMLPINPRQIPLYSERDGFAPPAPWMERSEMPFISQAIMH
jgi:hypothetical protein